MSDSENMKANPLMKDVIRRHKELLEKQQPGTPEYSRSKEIVDEDRHNDLVRLSTEGVRLAAVSKRLQVATIIIAAFTLIATIIAIIVHH
jgi:hypothetical protein